MDELLRRQWVDLRNWMDVHDVSARADRASGLDGWTVGDLLAHLGRGMATLEAVQPASEGTRALTLGSYVAAYPAAAKEIEVGTRELAAAIEHDLLGSVDHLVLTGFEALASLPDGVCLAPRGPIERSDFVLTRLIELVVHGDDLARALDAPSPVRADALAVVGDALAAAYQERTGTVPHRADELVWLRQATGREQVDDPALPLL